MHILNSIYCRFIPWYVISLKTVCSGRNMYEEHTKITYLYWQVQLGGLNAVYLYVVFKQ
jgi:hypothetical protein